MPIGYLIPALLILMSAYMLLTPMSWPRPFRFMWVITAVVSELPHIAAAFLLANTTLAFYEGDIVSVGGWIVFGLNVIAIVALVVLFALARRTPPAIRLALDAGLGDGWRAVLPLEVVDRLERNFSARALLGPFGVRGGNVEHLRDVSYGEAEGRFNKLDVYRGRGGGEGRPVFIYLHGGALRGGKKDKSSLPVLYHLADNGWVCVSANYRLQPEAAFDEQVADVRQVIAWVRASIETYGGDPGFVMIGGGSSGGHLAALVGLEPGKVEAVVGLYGQFYFGPADESPITYVNPEAPPFLLLHGDHDNLVPVEGSRRLAQALRQVSWKPVVYAELPYADHNFDQFNSIRSLAVAHAVEAFGEWAFEMGRRQRPVAKLERVSEPLLRRAAGL